MQFHLLGVKRNENPNAGVTAVPSSKAAHVLTKGSSRILQFTFHVEIPSSRSASARLAISDIPEAKQWRAKIHFLEWEVTQTISQLLHCSNSIDLTKRLFPSSPELLGKKPILTSVTNITEDAIPFPSLCEVNPIRLWRTYLTAHSQACVCIVCLSVMLSIVIRPKKPEIKWFLGI
jgi:hypothetical protein